MVFDVLRATTSMVAALAAGAAEIRVYDSIQLAHDAGMQYPQETRLLCGELKCLPPAGFDLGNSPGDFSSQRVSGKTIFLSTTNGTRAIAAARDAKRLFAAALINASAMANELLRIGLDVTLLCAGTNGDIAPEDLIGAGAVASVLLQHAGSVASPEAMEAIELFDRSAASLPSVLRVTQGGKNIIAAKLDPDIDFAARLNTVNIVVEVSGEFLAARRMIDS